MDYILIFVFKITFFKYIKINYFMYWKNLKTILKDPNHFALDLTVALGFGRKDRKVKENK